jgi:hypothetical protein
VGAFFKRSGYRLFRLGTRPRWPLSPIANLDAGWPAPDGVWGTVVAVHPTRAFAGL